MAGRAKTSLSKTDHVYLVDGSGYIFRAYHALPPLTRRTDKLPIGAVAGFCNMLVRLMDDMDALVSPTHLAVIFDASARSFRNDIYPDYKANRGEPPEDLVPQFPLVREAVRAFGVPSIELEGYEADDLIASYACLAAEQGAQVTIVSSDKDLMQLVNTHITMMDTMKNRHIGVDEVFEKFGVGPERVIDVQALAGDSSDNVPGVPGIGVKTAALLIQEFGDLETLLTRAGEIKQNKRRENLLDFAEQARLSRELVTLKKDTPLPVALPDMSLAAPEPDSLMGFLKAMEFETLTKRLAKRYDINPDDFTPSATLAAGAGAGGATGTTGAGGKNGEKNENNNPGKDGGDSKGSKRDKNNQAGQVEAGGALDPDGIFIPQNLPDMPAIDPSAYECVTDKARLQFWIDEAYERGFVALDTETDGLNAMTCTLVGLSLATAPGHACYIPLAHKPESAHESELIHEEEDNRQNILPQLATDDVLAALAPLLGDESVLKILQNAKFDLLILARHHIEIAPIDDTMLLSYALAAGARGHGMDELSQHYLNHKPISIKTLLGTGKKQITFDKVPIDKATAYAAEDADITLRLWYYMKPELVQKGVVGVYETTERPLVPVIVAMERQGVRVDGKVLKNLSDEFAAKMTDMEKNIYALAGGSFNIASPRQLGDILFDRLGLPDSGKTATGAWRTGADILEKLAADGHELPAHILAWRALAKLKSTYTDALPGFVNPQSGRIHTSYALATTSTGRLSSSDPNLQNIPIRTDDGRRIRTAFIAEKGKLLVSADYSQIELRVLAHIADIATLKQAFADGLDIHALTASEIFGISLDDMTPEIRRRAKAINFGIIYGISAFGLANQLDIPRSEARDYIASYFEKFPGIKDYMEMIKEEARAQGFVTTLFGRKIHTPEINAKNHARRAFSERAAINAPIQGTAADIIRRAMIAVMPTLGDAGLNAHMLLQVHDELIFETAKSDAEDLMALARQVMQNACAPRLQLSVPLVVDARAAKNWDEAH